MRHLNFIDAHTRDELTAVVPGFGQSMTNELSMNPKGVWTVADVPDAMPSHVAELLNNGVAALWELSQGQSPYSAWIADATCQQPTLIFPQFSIGHHNYEFVLRKGRGDAFDGMQYNKDSGKGRKLTLQPHVTRFPVAERSLSLHLPVSGDQDRAVVFPDFFKWSGPVPANTLLEAQIRRLCRDMNMSASDVEGSSLSFTVLNLPHHFEMMYRSAILDAPHNLLWLAHGTRSKDAVDSICKTGFNRGYGIAKGDTNFQFLGRGNYAAMDIPYSMDPRYSPVLNDGYQHIFLCVAAPGNIHIYNSTSGIDYTRLMTAPDDARCVYHEDDKIFCFSNDVSLVPVIHMRIPA